MATNVTEKDKTLNEIIDWAKSRCHEAALSRFDVRRKSDRDFYDGQVNAFHEILELCCSMLGYSGSMPSEVSNQSEDAKKSSASEILPHDMDLRVGFLPHDMGLRVELDTNETCYLKSGWKERGDGIYGLAVSYTDGSGIVSVSRPDNPVPIAIMNSHVRLAVSFDEHGTETTK